MKLDFYVASRLRQEFADHTGPIRFGKAIGRRADGRLFLGRQMMLRGCDDVRQIDYYGDYVEHSDLPAIDLPNIFIGTVGEIAIVYRIGWLILGGG